MGLNDLRIEEQDLSSADMTLEAREGEALEILARGQVGGGDGQDIQESIRETTMRAYPGDDGEDDMVPESPVIDRGQDIHGLLRDMGFDIPTLKVPEGHDYTLTDVDGNATASTVYYREHDAGQVSNGEPGTPESNVRLVHALGEARQDSVATGTTVTETYDNSFMPSGFSDFPFEERVPSGREYELLAIAATTDTDSGDTNALDTLRLEARNSEFLARNDDFIDQDKFSFPSDNFDTIPFIFPEPPTFTPGDELNLESELTNDSGSSANVVAHASLIMLRREVR